MMMLAMGGAQGQTAVESRMMPATIGVGANSLARMIVIPEERKTMTFMSVIRCQTYVTASGELEDTLCVRDSLDDLDLRRSVLDAIGEARFSPARVGGKNVPVYMGFMVAFSCGDGDCSVLAVPHNGYHIADFGLEYVAPQAIMDDKFWDKRAWERDNSLFLWTTPGYIFFLSALVDKQGNASDVSIDHVDSAWRTEARRAATYFERMNFIPGYYGGAPTSMRAHDFMGIRLRGSGGPR